MVMELPRRTRPNRRRLQFRWLVIAVLFVTVGIVGVALVVAIH